MSPFAAPLSLSPLSPPLFPPDHPCGAGGIPGTGRAHSVRVNVEPGKGAADQEPPRRHLGPCAE
ncbi:unnamed protein product, partial [Closterium sp. NIES-53]